MDAEVKPPPNVLLAGIVGSTAYGLAHEGSDIDRLGAYAAPTVQFHGLDPPCARDKTLVSTRPDATYHEAGKQASLMLRCNPHATELAWLSAYEVITPEGEALITIRSSFLSAPEIRNAYLGYATQQLRRIRNRGNGALSPDARSKASKHARHLWRLLYQGCQLHQAGHLPVRLPPAQAQSCREFGETVAAGDLAIADEALRAAGEAFDAPGVLPDRPDKAAAEAWLQDVRRAYWDRS
jgi:predicted nucleotidyltransferase